MPAINPNHINIRNIIRKATRPVVLLLLVLLATCIEPFRPDIDKYDSVMVIFGELVETDSIQKVEVTTSSNYNERKQLPVTGCVVYVEDDRGNVFNYTETGEGAYTCRIEPQFLTTGVSYRLVVNTNNGSVYASEYDKMVECPDIDTVYHAIEENVIGAEELGVLGVQFYVDVRSKEGQAGYCRWSLDETWLYRAYYEVNAKVYNGEMIRFQEPAFVPICWMSRKITSVHTAQVENQIKPVEINYVSNQSPRLYYKYSLHVRQFGISESAYAFWSTLGEQFEEAGELYEKQPQSIQSNIKNINDEEEIVLGFFNTASVKETRVFVERNWNLPVDDYCDFELLPDDKEQWPTVAYLYIEPMVPDIVMSEDSACFVCTARGGTSIKPDFWED